MMSGGRIRHHLKNNIGNPAAHLVIVGYQASGTLGRRIVDGADEIRFFGETFPVRASIHTIGGLSAHADQKDLVHWYGNFASQPPLYLVHGEPRAQKALARELESSGDVPVHIAKRGQVVNL